MPGMLGISATLRLSGVRPGKEMLMLGPKALQGRLVEYALVQMDWELCGWQRSTGAALPGWGRLYPEHLPCG